MLRHCAGLSRVDVKYVATLAYHSFRFPDMYLCMSIIAKDSLQEQNKSENSGNRKILSDVEQKEFALAFKLNFNALRHSWRTLHAIQKTEFQDINLNGVSRSHSPIRETLSPKAVTTRRHSKLRQSQVHHQTAENAMYIHQKQHEVFLEKIECEIRLLCKEYLMLLEELITTTSSTEESVFYKTLKADCYRYLLEFPHRVPSEICQLRTACINAYTAAMQEAKAIHRSHALRQGVALNFAVFHHDVMDNREEAYRIAQKAFDDAIREFDDFRPYEIDITANAAEVQASSLTLDTTAEIKSTQKSYDAGSVCALNGKSKIELDDQIDTSPLSSPSHIATATIAARDAITSRRSSYACISRQSTYKNDVRASNIIFQLLRNNIDNWCALSHTTHYDVNGLCNSPTSSARSVVYPAAL